MTLDGCFGLFGGAAVFVVSFFCPAIATAAVVVLLELLGTVVDPFFLLVVEAVSFLHPWVVFAILVVDGFE